ncbi:hypothetical protein ACF0H5_003342 [Mactra antiquata]
MSSIKVDKGSSAMIQRSGLIAFKEPLQLFLSIVKSSRSPCGNVKVLQSSNGGNVSFTSSSKRLFKALSVRKPVIRLLVTAAQGHLEAYSDNGLFLSTFSTDLVLRSMNSSKNLRILNECYEIFLTLCLQYFNRDCCNFKYPAVISDLRFIQSFVRTVLKSKPLCTLNEEKLSHLCKLIIDLFLHGATSEKNGIHLMDSVYILSYPGIDVLESSSYRGLALLAPECSKFKTQTLQPKSTKCENEMKIKLALVAMSMSGDLEELSTTNYEVTTDITWDSVILEGLSKFCDSLIQFNVGLVLCQKVIHPQLKIKLKNSGVIVVDRVGSYPMKYICTLSGCKPILSIENIIPDDCYGYISNVQHKIIHQHSYIHLSNTNNCLSTLVLCHNYEEMLNELKDVCITCIDNLQQLLYEPYILSGGGCWQTGLATYLLNKVTSDIEELSIQHDIPVSVLKEESKVFHDSLVDSVMSNKQNYVIDSNTGHICTYNTLTDTVITDYCCCQIYEVNDRDIYVIDDTNGMKFGTNLLMVDTVDSLNIKKSFKERDVVIDVYRSAVNAFQTAVLTACSILKIGQVIENV